MNGHQCSRSHPFPSGSLIQLRNHSTQLIAIGVLLLFLGFLGFVGQVYFSIFSISILALFALIAGVVQGIHASQSKEWKSVGVQVLISILYILAGILIFIYPIATLEGLTFWLAIFFFVTGFLRFVSAFHHRNIKGWAWTAISGMISVFIAVLILNSWPNSSLWIPGLLIAVELVLQGWSLLFIGVALKSSAKVLEEK